MKQPNKKILENLITNYVDSTLMPVDHLFAAQKESELELVYGETYDVYGLTIDSLKYYLFLAVLQFVFDSASCKVIIGDVASIRNKGADESLIQAKTEENLKLMGKIKSVFTLPINFVRMSTIFEMDSFKEKLKLVQKEHTLNKDMQSLATNTVMRNRLKQENEAGFQYSLEEVALIVDPDIKIGAMREVTYDKMANIVREKAGTKPLMGVYLKPTYPLGVQFDYFLQHPEIEKYGLTPYKAGSNKLQAHRVILGVTKIADIKVLANKTFNPDDVSLPNALRDLNLISLLAEVMQSKEISLLENPDIYKTPTIEAVISRVEKYIYKPLGLE